MSPLIRLCSGVALLAPPVAAVTVLAAGWFAPGYDPVTRTVSRLAVPGASTAGAVDVAMLTAGLACIAVAVGVRSGIGGRASLALAGFGFVAAGVFHLDPLSLRLSAPHWAGSGLAVLGLTVAPLALWRAYGRVLLALGVAEVAMLLVGLALLPTSFVAWGAWERVLLMLGLSSIVFLGVRIRRRERRMPSSEEAARAMAAVHSSAGT